MDAPIVQLLLGGNIAAQIMSGRCDQPPAYPADKESMVDPLCDGYTPMLDERGQPLIKAAVLYEGYSPASAVHPPLPGATIAYVAGRANNATWTSGCVIHASLAAGISYV